jgi:hypothetical protein
MKIRRNFIAAISLAAVVAKACAEDDWQDALSRMPLCEVATGLNRTNCVQLMLGAFQSNGVVKALIFMPGATDEIYFFKRVRVTLTNASPSLLDAVAALTNQTCIQATFRPPLLLLHTTEDALDGNAIVKNESTAEKLRERRVPGFVLLNDSDWDGVLAALHRKLNIGLRPERGSDDSRHFYRHTLAACGLTQWEMLEALALAGKTTFTLHWLTVDYQPDPREGPVPKPETLFLR